MLNVDDGDDGGGAFLVVWMMVIVQRGCFERGRRIQWWQRLWWWWRWWRWDGGGVGMTSYRLEGFSRSRSFPESQRRKISAEGDGLNKTLKTPYYNNVERSWSSVSHEQRYSMPFTLLSLNRSSLSFTIIFFICCEENTTSREQLDSSSG